MIIKNIPLIGFSIFYDHLVFDYIVCPLQPSLCANYNLVTNFVIFLLSFDVLRIQLRLVLPELFENSRIIILKDQFLHLFISREFVLSGLTQMPVLNVRIYRLLGRRHRNICTREIFEGPYGRSNTGFYWLFLINIIWERVKLAN